MYSKQEASQLRQEFWTVFGQYMAPVLSAEGIKINWINYKTGIRDIAFRMQADTQKAAIAIDIMHKDADLQVLYFEQFRQLQQLLQEALGEVWTWTLHGQDEHGNLISRIYTEQPGISILKREDWPQLISFFKPRLVALDQFWSDARYVLESL